MSGGETDERKGGGEDETGDWDERAALPRDVCGDEAFCLRHRRVTRVGCQFQKLLTVSSLQRYVVAVTTLAERC